MLHANANTKMLPSIGYGAIDVYYANGGTLFSVIWFDIKNLN